MIHALLVLLVAQPASDPTLAADGSFIFHVSMQPGEAASPAADIAPAPAGTTPAALPALPAQPPPALPVLDAPVTVPAEKYYEARELDTLPAPKREINPQYPPEAMAARMSGMVQLEIFVDETGEIQSLQVLRSTTPDVFDQAALDAFRAQPFSPGIKNGRPVRTHLKLVVNFGDHPEGSLQ